MRPSWPHTLYTMAERQDMPDTQIFLFGDGVRSAETHQPLAKPITRIHAVALLKQHNIEAAEYPERNRIRASNHR